MYQGAFRSLHIERFEDVRLVTVPFSLLTAEFFLLNSLYCIHIVNNVLIMVIMVLLLLKYINEIQSY